MIVNDPSIQFIHHVVNNFMIGIIHYFYNNKQTANNQMSRIPLKFPCPGNDCPKSQIKDWVHKDCNTTSFIDIKGIMDCDSCNHRYSIMEAEFKCNFRKHGVGYVKWSKTQFFTVLSAYTSSVEVSERSEKERQFWVSTFIENMHQYR